MQGCSLDTFHYLDFVHLQDFGDRKDLTKYENKIGKEAPTPVS